MARILSKLAKTMFFKVLALILLQGVLTSDDSVVDSGSSPGARSSGLLRSSVSARQQLSAAAGSRSRAKRCTCYSYKDKECVYYCHLDIIWINTPERTVPYGMSSYPGPQRIRRAVTGRLTKQEGAEQKRCVCLHSVDSKCQDFCLSSAVKTVPPRSLKRTAGPG